MLKSKARRRVALKTAALATAGVGVLAAYGLASPAQADQRTVRYNCTPSGQNAAQPYDLTVNLVAPTLAPVGTGFAVTFQVTSTGASPLLVPNAIEAGNAVVIQPFLEVEGNPPAGSRATVSPMASYGVTTPIPQQGTLPALPAAPATVTPSTGATALVVTARDFHIRLVDGSGQVRDPNLFVCQIDQAATPAAATIRVSAAGTTSPTPTTSPTATPTPTPTTPRPTITRTETVTASPIETRTQGKGRVTRTPEGTVETGGGGDAGPDGRMFVLAGSLMVLGAGIGGLFLRRRTITSKG